MILLDWAGTIVVLCGVRLALRLYYEEIRSIPTGRLTRMLIVGAGDAGEALLREIHRMPTSNYEVVGYVDDDTAKQGARIHGVPVLGGTEDIRQIAEANNVDEIAIAMPSASHKELRRVIELCQGANLRFQYRARSAQYRLGQGQRFADARSGHQ